MDEAAYILQYEVPPNVSRAYVPESPYVPKVPIDAAVSSNTETPSQFVAGGTGHPIPPAVPTV